MRNINEDKPVIAREPGKGGKGKLGAVLLGPDGKPIPGSWRSIEDLTAEKKNPPQANIDYFLKLERERKKSQPPAPAIPPTTLKPDSGKGLSPAPSPPGTPERNKLEAEIEAANKARREAEAAKPAPAKPAPRPTPLTADQKSNAEYQKLRTTDPEAAKKLGMEIWAKKYSDASGKSKFTVPSVEKGGSRIDVATARQKEIISAVRGNRPIPPVTPVTKTKVDTAPAGTPPTGMTLSRQYQGNDTPGRLGQLETGYAGKPVKKKPQPGAGAPMGGPYTEAYDVVLDYLLSEGHAETVEEAHYIMMQLDSEYIQSIVEN